MEKKTYLFMPGAGWENYRPRLADNSFDLSLLTAKLLEKKNEDSSNRYADDRFSPHRTCVHKEIRLRKSLIESMKKTSAQANLCIMSRASETRLITAPHSYLLPTITVLLVVYGTCIYG